MLMNMNTLLCNQ